jgi:hypothetical protein
MKTYAVEPLVPEPSAFEADSFIVKFKSYSSSGNDQMPAEPIQVGGKTRSEIHKFINCIWSKEELSDQWKKSYCISLQEG